MRIRFRLEILSATDYVTKTCSAWYRAPVRYPSPISIPFPLKISRPHRRQAVLSRDRDKWPYQEWFRSVDYRVTTFQIRLVWKTCGWVNLDERCLIFRGLQEVIQFGLFTIRRLNTLWFAVWRYEMFAFSWIEGYLRCMLLSYRIHVLSGSVISYSSYLLQSFDASKISMIVLFRPHFSCEIGGDHESLTNCII